MSMGLLYLISWFRVYHKFVERNVSGDFCEKWWRRWRENGEKWRENDPRVVHVTAKRETEAERGRPERGKKNLGTSILTFFHNMVHNSYVFI